MGIIDAFRSKPKEKSALETQDERIKQLSDQIIKGNKFERKIEGVTNYFRLIFNRSVLIWDRMELANFAIDKFCSPTSESADNRFLKRKLFAWSSLFGEWTGDFWAFNTIIGDYGANANLFLQPVYSWRQEMINVLPYLMKEYYDLELVALRQYLAEDFNKIWHVTWQSKHVELQWAMFMAAPNNPMLNYRGFEDPNVTRMREEAAEAPEPI